MRASYCARLGLAAALLFLPLGLRAADGDAEILFRFPVGGVVTTGPVIDGGRAWFISDSRTLYVITVDGKAIGKRSISSRRAPFIACDPYGRAVIPDGARGILMVNKAGQEVWRRELGSAPFGPPSFGPDGRLYVLADDSLVCLAPNGMRLWERPHGAMPSAASVRGPEGGPLLLHSDGRAVLLGQDGQMLWEEAYQSMPVMAAALPDGFAIAFSDGSIRFFTRRGASFGAMETVSLGSRPIALAAGPDGYAVLAEKGRLAALSPAGEELWSRELGTRLAAARLSCFKDRIVVEAGNELSSYGPDGELFRRLSVKNAGGAPVMASSGTVFAGGNDWILYAYRFERPLEALPLPVPALLDRQSILDAGRKALLWYPGGSSDDVVIAMLADIEKSLKSGTIGGSASEAALAAAAVALGELEAPFGFGPLQQGPMPKGALARVQACELLGSLGFPAAVDVLAQVFRVDREPAVRAAAASAVAAIGLDPGGKALDAFADAAATRLDTRVARSVIGAIEALYRASGGLDKPSGALALLRIMGEAAYPGDLRRRAEETLRRLTSP